MGGLDNWDPGQGGADAPSKKAQLFSTQASDGKDTMTGTNELKRMTGKSGKPKGPFGAQERSC